MSLVITGLTEVAGDFAAAAARLEVNAVTAVAVTARKVQQDARERIRGHKYLPRYPTSISYDVRRTVEGVEAEIGPDKGRAQGALGNILEFGTVKNGPLPHLGPALEANADDAERGIETAVLQALR